MVGGLKPGDPQLIGPYRLVGQLGSGGMGRVFLGLSAGGRPVAVKVIRAELAADPEFRVRFAREVAAARQVSGLFTALVVDADVDGPVPWLATAYVSGPALSDAVARHGPMPAGPALALAAGLAEGLSAIHAAGVVHCDLKPSNVLLSQDGPRVIDFGISRAAEAAWAAGVGLVVGSPGFMSPEQALGEEIGPSSDIFSLGAVLTFAATGGGPFGRGSGPELAYRLVYSPPDLGRLPAQLRPLVEQCLAKDPGQRPTADEVLAEASAGQPAPWLPPALTGGRPSPALAGGQLGPGLAAALVPAPREPSSLPLPPRPARRARWWRPLTAAVVAAGVVVASVAVSFALSGASRPSSSAQFLPGAAPTLPAPAVPSMRPPAVRSPARGPAPKPAIIPAAVTVTSPAASATVRPSATPTPTPSPSRSSSAPPSPSPSASPSSPSPAPSPSSPGPSEPVPQITGVETYARGSLVYFVIQYADPGNDAEGFGFMGLNGYSWVTETDPFTSPGPGIAGPDSITYPLDLECGTALQHSAQVEAWIYDAAGARSEPVMIQLACEA